MSLVYKGVTVTKVIYNGVDLDKVIYNGVTVFEKAPAIIREPATGDYYNFTTPPYTAFFSLGFLFFNSSAYIALTPTLPWSDGTWTYYKGSFKETRTDMVFGTYDGYGVYRVKN